MLRATFAIAIITTLCVLSPVREARRDSGSFDLSQVAVPAGMETLVAAAAGQALSLASARGHESAATIPAGREPWGTAPEGIRRVVAVPQTPLEMPPLRP